MVEPAELPSRAPKEEKTPEEKRKELKVIKGGGKKKWGLGAKTGAIVGSTAAVVSSVAAALGETDNLPDPLQGFYDQAFHPGKVVEEKNEEDRGKYDVEEASEDLTKIVEETKPQKETSSPEKETSIESALETILKEKVPFISEALPGAELDTKTGEIIAKVGNEWGIKEGESIGWYVVEAFKMETADGVEKQEDAIGLIPQVIEAMQNKIFDEKGEKPFPIPINLKETEDVKITELKINAGIVSGVLNFGINVPIGTIVYAPLSGEYNLSSLSEATDIETKDKSVGGSYESDLKKEGEGIVHLIGAFSINFVEDNNIIFDINDIKTKAIPIEDGQEILINFYELKLGDPLIEITSLAFLDATVNKFKDIWYYEKLGYYQLSLENLKHFFEGYGPPDLTETVDLLSLKGKQESEVIKVFISPNEPAHE